jgi:hypothetical protein
MEIRRLPPWAVAVEGVAALAASVVAGSALPTYTATAAMMSAFGADGRPQLALLTLSLTATAVMVAPLLARPLGRGGGWAVATLGLIIVAVVNRPLSNVDVSVLGRSSLLVAASGLVLGGVVAALAAGPKANRLVVALGLAAGLPASPGVIALAYGTGSGPQWSWPSLAVVAAVAAAGAAVVVGAPGRRREAAPADTAAAPVPEEAVEPPASRDPEEDAAGTAAAPPAGEDPDPPARPAAREDAFAMVWPTLVVAAVAGAVLLVDALRLTVADAIAVSPDGFATPRRAQAVTVIDWVARLGLVLAVGTLLAWCGYARGRGSVGRWVWTGLGLMVLLSPTTQRAIVQGPGQTWLLLVLVVSAAGLGVLLARVADRAAPWDALGLLLVAVGLLLAVRQLDQELTWGPPLHPYVIGAGLGLALGAGLGRVAAWPDRARPPYARATDAGLGFAAALLAAGVMTPLLLPIAYGQRMGPGVPWQPPAVVTVAAVVVALFFGLARAVDRIRRDIRAEAAEAPR